MKHVMGEKRGRGMLSVKVPIVDKEGNTTPNECATQQESFKAAEPVLANHSGAFSLSLYSGRLFYNLVFMGDTE